MFPFQFRFWPLPPAAALVWALASCSIPQVDPADPARTLAVGARSGTNQIWPQRPQPTFPPFEVKRGEPPVDQGVFKNCRVFKAGDLKDGVALFLAGRRWDPIADQDEPFELTVVGRGMTHEIKLLTKEHRITLAVARAAKTEKPRGLVLYLASIMLISDEEKSFIRSLQARGWNVAAITPSIDIFTKDRWPLAWKEDELGKQATFLAREIDNYLAETTYAAESVLAYLQEKHPQWTKGSRVVIGASAGALAAPALIKRIGGVDAAVFIGGGAHIPEILLESQIDIYHPEIAIEGRDKLGGAERRQKQLAVRSKFKQLALYQTRLDPLHLAPSLRPTPTLMLTGQFDRIVPAHTGDYLYNALGKPERWRFPTGHVLLFLSLPLQGNRVADWLDAHTAAASR